MTTDKKSKEERIKFLKLMGCKNVEANWETIEAHIAVSYTHLDVYKRQM